METKVEQQSLAIKAPDIRSAMFRVVGTAQLVQHKFSRKAQEQIKAAQEEGSAAKNKRKRPPKDFTKLAMAACHRSANGQYGVPASSIRNALISACRVSGMAMTKAKLSVFCRGSINDAEDHTELVPLLDPETWKPIGEPEILIAPARNDNGGMDLRSRPMWTRWALELVIQFDGDQFTMVDVANLLARAGLQVGIGEGRPDSKKSAGMGWGTFELDNREVA